MGTGYSRSPLLLKGALVELTAPFLIPVPNVIVFQYNPETVTRSLKPWRFEAQSSGGGDEEQGQTTLLRNGRVQPYDPQETVSLTLIVDATDALEAPESHPVATVAGVADRLAALEKLLYPIGGGGGLLSVEIDISLGGASGSLSAEEQAEVEQRMTPVTLFFWGPGRIVPVRVTSFQVTEKHFNPLLYPVRAEVQLGMQVLTDADFEGDDSVPAEIAKFAYKFTRTQQDVLALANLANSVESIVGMLPI
jgi:hypothetical protein